MNKVCFERVWFELYGFLNGRNWFFKLSRKPIFPPKRRHRCANPTSNDAVLSPRFNNAFVDSLAQSVRTL